MPAENLFHETKSLLRRYGIRPKKKLGQNFLVSKRLLVKIIRSLSLGPSDTIVEVGAGLGTLTIELAKRAGRVIAVEVDRRLIEVLEDRLRGFSNVEIIEGDILKMDLPECDKVTGNIPYYISSKLLVKLLREPRYTYAVFMLQKEFAERLIAKPGTANYGRISIIAQIYGEITILDKAGRRAFYPAPKVESALIKIKPKLEARRYINHVERITAILFSQRRRKVGKVLLKAGVDTSTLRDIIDVEKRVYELTPQEILLIAESIYTGGE